jgi:hypothetical protein
LEFHRSIANEEIQLYERHFLDSISPLHLGNLLPIPPRWGSTEQLKTQKEN